MLFINTKVKLLAIKFDSDSGNIPFLYIKLRKRYYTHHILTEFFCNRWERYFGEKSENISFRRSKNIFRQIRLKGWRLIFTINECLYVCMFGCLYVCMFIYLYICMFVSLDWWTNIVVFICIHQKYKVSKILIILCRL